MDNMLMTSVSIGWEQLWRRYARDFLRQHALEKRYCHQRRIERMAHGKHARRAGRS